MLARLAPVGLLLSTLGLAGCNLLFSLDSLQSGGSGGGGGAGEGGAGAGAAGGPGSGAGGEGGSSSVGGGGAGTGGSTPSYEEVVLADGPVFYAPMGGAGDTEPNLGTLGGTATYSGPHAPAEGLVTAGEATTFDDPAVALNDPAEDDTGKLVAPPLALAGDPVFDGARAFTIELWLAPAAVVETANLLLVDDLGVGGVRVRSKSRIVSDGLDQLAFAVRDGASDYTAYVSLCNFDDWAEGAVEHWVFVHDPDQAHALAVYRNGARCDDTAGEKVTGSFSLPTVLAPVGVGEGFSGSVDEVAIYDFAMTPATICAHWAAGGGAGC